MTLLSQSLFGMVAIFASALFVPHQANASDPLSPNRLVFNFLAQPIADVNGDGEIDILDTLPSIPPSTDAIVYIGEDAEAQVYSLNATGEPVVNFSSGAVNRLEDAVTLAAALDVPLYLRGHFAMTDAIRIRSSVSISGYSTSPTVIHSIIEGGTALINIKSRASDVVIENLRLNEVLDLSVSMLLMSGLNERITIDKVDFTGQRVGAIFQTTAAVLMSQDWIKDVLISNCKISDFQYGIHCLCGVRKLRILNNEFRRWSSFALRIARLASQESLRSEDISIVGNDFRDPMPGLFKSVIFVTRGESLLYIRDVHVNRNTIYSDGGAFQRGDSTSNATGDQVVLHGVNGFEIIANQVFHGGENGITASTLSRNGIIARNVVHGNDTHGIVIGSGLYELSVSSVAKIKLNQRIRGVDSGAEASVRSIRVHPLDGRIVVGLHRKTSASIFRNEKLDNLTTGAKNVASASIVDRTKNILVFENFVFGNGLDQANNTPFTFGIYVQNADTIDIVRNRIYNPNYDFVRAFGGLQDQRLSVFLANSRDVLVSRSNQFEFGAETLTQGVGRNSSTWLR